MSCYVFEGLLAKRKRSTSKNNVKERVQKVLNWLYGKQILRGSVVAQHKVVTRRPFVLQWCV